MQFLSEEQSGNIDKKQEKKDTPTSDDSRIEDIAIEPVHPEEVEFGFPPESSESRCWNCKSILHNNDWCDVCRVPINNETKAEVMNRHTSDKSVKCWRCKGTMRPRGRSSSSKWYPLDSGR